VQTLYLIRHTTPDIAAGICYGQLDIGLADSFEVEAAEVARGLPPVQLIFNSPLLRTRQLGEYLARLQQCELRSEARLMEKHFGEWEGKAWDDIPRGEIDAWAADIMGYASPGGESPQQLMLRVQTLLSDVASLPQQSIVLVAHGGSLRAILAHVAAVSLTDIMRWELDYGAVIALRLPAGSTGNYAFKPVLI